MIKITIGYKLSLTFNNTYDLHKFSALHGLLSFLLHELRMFIKTKINNCYSHTVTDIVLLFIQNQLIIFTIIK